MSVLFHLEPSSAKEGSGILRLYWGQDELRVEARAEDLGTTSTAIPALCQGEGKFPALELTDRIDELHAFSVRLRKEALDLSQARLGFTFFRRLLGLHIGPDKLDEWIDFCSEIGPKPPEDFIPAAMDLFHIQRATGKSYGEIASEVKELSSQREKLASEVEDLKPNEIKAKELRAEIPKIQEEAQKLRMEEYELEGTLSTHMSFIEELAEKLGISPDEFEPRFKELASLEEELAGRRSEKSKLVGEIEALTERQEKLSSRMEKASADFDRDMKLITSMRNELVRIAEMKGRYAKELEDMELAVQIIPFLRYPDKVDDPDFELASAVVGCVDKWLIQQNLGLPWGIKWGDITRHVQSKRAQLR